MLPLYLRGTFLYPCLRVGGLIQNGRQSFQSIWPRVVGSPEGAKGISWPTEIVQLND